MIPDISFSKGSRNSGIDVIDLHAIQTRGPTLDHNPEEPHRVAFYLMILIEEGHGHHFIDFKRHTFKKNDLIFINKQQIHAFDFSQPLCGKVMLFTDDFIKQVQSHMHFPLFSSFYLTSHWQPVFTPGQELQIRANSLLKEAEYELQHNDSRQMILMLLFSALLMMIMREKRESRSNDSQKYLASFERFVDLLETRFTDTRDANDYADKLNITYKTLNLICKKVSNQTAKQVVDNYTILEARRRLILSGQPIQQLAYELGFDEATNFVKYFKKHTGMTPSQFRKQ